MRLPRPYIPLKVRAKVIARQAVKAGMDFEAVSLLLQELQPGRVVAVLLKHLFGNAVVHLDHDPPLAARAKVKTRGGEFIAYKPDANDPRYLIYRDQFDHRVKTYIRGEHGQYSDTALIKRARKRERPKKKKAKRRWPVVKFDRFPPAPKLKRVKVRWPKRSFPKGRGFVASVSRSWPKGKYPLGHGRGWGDR